MNVIAFGGFCTKYKLRQFFSLLFQLLPIISFLALPILYSHIAPLRLDVWGKYSEYTLVSSCFDFKRPLIPFEAVACSRYLALSS